MFVVRETNRELFNRLAISQQVHSNSYYRRMSSSALLILFQSLGTTSLVSRVLIDMTRPKKRKLCRAIIHVRIRSTSCVQPVHNESIRTKTRLHAVTSRRQWLSLLVITRLDVERAGGYLHSTISSVSSLDSYRTPHIRRVIVVCSH